MIVALQMNNKRNASMLHVNPIINKSTDEIPYVNTENTKKSMDFLTINKKKKIP